MPIAIPHRRLTSDIRIRYWLLTWSVFLTLSSTSTAFGQTADAPFSQHPDFVVRQWTAAEGLPVSGVTGLYQDEQGFLWMTTLAGLVRFDGRNVEVFERSAHPELPSNRLAYIYPLEGIGYLLLAESREVILFDGTSFENLSSLHGFESLTGHLAFNDSEFWLFTDKGILSLRGVADADFISQTEYEVYSGVRTGTDEMWIGSNQGLLRLGEELPFERYSVEDGLPDNNVLGIVPEEDEVYLATGGGLVRWSLDEATELFRANNPGNPINAWFLMEYGNEVLVGTDTGWLRIEGDVLVPDFSKGAFPLLSPGIYNTPPVTDNNGDFWYAGNGSVYRNDTVVLETDGTINQLHPNRSGGVWVAHNVLGLFLVRPSAVSTIGTPEGLPGDNAYGLVEDEQGRMWVGLLDTRQFARHDGAQSDLQFSSGTPWAAGMDGDGSIWLGGAGLCRVVGRECTSELTQGMDPGVRAIHSDSEDRLWIGTQSGLWVRESPESDFRRIPSSVQSPWVRFVSESNNGDLLFGTFGQGLGYLKGDSLLFWDESSGFPSNNIRSILPFDSGEVWIGSEDVGLIVVPTATAPGIDGTSPKVIGRDDGLPDNSVHAMITDAAGNVWANSNRGIFRLEPDNVRQLVLGKVDRLSAVAIDDKSGMRNREGNGGMQSAGYLDQEGRIRFPTQQGVAIIDPESVSDPIPRRVTILSVTASGRTMNFSGPSVSLASDETTAEVRFSSPHFTSSEDVSFRYRMEGVTDDWINLGPDNLLSLTGLPEGENRLDLQAGIAGRWSSETTSLVFNRRAAFAESPWFVVLLIAFGISSGALMVFGRTQVVRRRNELLERQVQERTATIEQQALRLAELDDLKSKFFGNISHELRTPLTLIKGPISSLLENASHGENEDLSHQLDVVDRNVDRLTSLVNDILDLTALEAGTFQLNVQLDDLEAFTQRIAGFFTRAADEKGILLDVYTPGEPILWTFDGARMEHVLFNLIGNALKYTSTGGHIEVSLEVTQENEALLIVKDSGKGISSDDLPRVFDRYFRGDNQDGLKGSGIGLSLCKDLVEMHGGRIDVESTLGSGSTFFIWLPQGDSSIADDDAPVADPRPRHVRSVTAQLQSGISVAESSDLRPTLLIAEDNPELLEFLASSLIRRFNVMTASDGREALELCRQAVPDLVITDVMMPEMTGTELCSHIKEELPTSHIPVVMLTAKGDIDSRTTGLWTGADVYLTKPFETRELLAYIDSLLLNRRRIQEALSSHVAASPELVEEQAGLSPLDKDFLSATQEAIQSSLSDAGYTVEDLADQVHLSTRQFHRKMEAITGYSPADYVRRVRLDEAARLIEEGRMALKEVASAVGFNSASGFRKAFKDRFGVPPSQWQPK